jgi:hypothetical protein
MNKQNFSVLLTAAIIALLTPSCLKRIDPLCPTIDSLNPSAARFDDIVSIKGKDFVPNTPSIYKINIGDTTISAFGVPDENTLQFKVPRGKSGQVTVSLQGSSKCTSNAKEFTYYYKGTRVELFAGTPGCNAGINCLNLPMGIDLDQTKSNLIVADYYNSVVRKFSLSSSASATFGQFGVTPLCNSYPVTNASSAYFNKPADVAVGLNGDIYVAEDIVCLISVIRNSAQGTTDLMAGICPRDSKFVDGLCNVARLSAPYSVSIDGNSLYFADNGRVRVAEFNGTSSCTTVGGSVNTRTVLPVNTAGQYFKAIEVSHSRIGQGPIFIADTKEGNIKALNLNQGITTLTPNFSTADGPMALTLDGRGNIFIAANNRIYVLYTNGNLIPLAGTGANSYSNGTDGDALTAQFYKPSGLAVDGVRGILFVADTYNHVIRKISFQ